MSADETAQMTEYALPEQRHRQTFVWSSHGVAHVQYASTFKSGTHPGMWVRKAADRANLCGSQRACLVGIDAEEWPTSRQPIPADDLARVTCARCRQRYETWARKNNLPVLGGDQ